MKQLKKQTNPSSKPASVANRLLQISIALNSLLLLFVFVIPAAGQMLS